MAPRKRPAGKKPATKIAQKPAVTKKVEFSPDRRITVSVGTSLDFGKAKVGLSHSENIKNDADADEFIDATFDSLVGKLEEKFDDLCDRVGGEAGDTEYEDDGAGTEDDADDEAGDDDGEWEDDDAGDDDSGEDDAGEDAGEEDDITEEDILAMKKAELVELIDEEGLDDINKKLPIKKLREAVIDAFFEPEGEEGEEEAGDEDGEWDDGEWDDEE